MIVVYIPFLIGIVALIGIECYYRGWNKGFDKGSKIWKDHSDNVAKIYEEAFDKLIKDTSR